MTDYCRLDQCGQYCLSSSLDAKWGARPLGLAVETAETAEAVGTSDIVLQWCSVPKEVAAVLVSFALILLAWQSGPPLGRYSPEMTRSCSHRHQWSGFGSVA